MSTTLPTGPDANTQITCPRCQQPIDPDVCCCGDLIKHHGWDHTPVPMGCDCFRHKTPIKAYDPFNL